MLPHKISSTFTLGGQILITNELALNNFMFWNSFHGGGNICVLSGKDQKHEFFNVIFTNYYLHTLVFYFSV